MSDLKDISCKAIDDANDELQKISQTLWNRPELNFEETFAHQLLTDFLEKRGFHVEKSFLLPTAFRATFGDPQSGSRVAIVCEYDALPDIGHACGHNLIAEAGIAAALGVKAALHNRSIGQLIVYGTPAEEGGNGKGIMIQKGAFKDCDVAMMVHPSPVDEALDVNTLAVQFVKVTYRGKATHASAFPWYGVNALDAAVLCYQSVSCMRQQMKPTWRVHGIITNGGSKPNIIPEEAELEYYIRAPTKQDLGLLREKMYGCFNSAAAATGCTVEINMAELPFLNVITNQALAEVFVRNATDLGVAYDPLSEGFPAGSTDMGNVSYEVPSIHPFYSIGSTAVNHTREFTEAAGSDEAQPFTIKQAKAMANTAIDIMTNPEILQRIRKEFEEEPRRK